MGAAEAVSLHKGSAQHTPASLEAGDLIVTHRLEVIHAARRNTLKITRVSSRLSIFWHAYMHAFWS